MRSQIRLGKVFGIQIGLHYSWFLIALLIVFSLNAQFHLANPAWSVGLVLGLAIATAVLFFVCLLLHELAHSLVAKARGIPVREITLFALGGVSQIDGESTDAKTEFQIAIVGPLTSAVIGLLCFGAVYALPKAVTPGIAMLTWLGYINFGLAAFNLVPGYPLDGGRILRSVLWWKSGDAERATHNAAVTGQVVGGLFVTLGIVQFFFGANVGGLWIAFIGWFLLQAAGETRRQASLKRAFENVRVGDIMSHDCATVDGHQSVQDLVERLFKSGRRCFVVMDDGHVAGLVTPQDIRQVSRTQWPVTLVDAVMRPLEGLHAVAPETPLGNALQVMAKENVNQLPVMSNSHLDGVLSRAEVLNYLQTRAELEQ
ncbi:MAG: site-2 protease family protein [Acidobacteriia bacterium]|nr:site-2 protease family protein [Terriglobia bacterium]